jgi:hybrid cluster-associated redox disulfide protein
MKASKPSNLKELKQRQKTIAELIEKDPDFASFLEQQGMMCASCPLARFETIDQGALVHGISPNVFKKPKKPSKKQIKKTMDSRLLDAQDVKNKHLDIKKAAKSINRKKTK